MPSRPQHSNESALVRNILAALQTRSIWAWRQNAGLQVLGAEGTSARRVIKGAPAGTPDIIGVLPGGVLFGLEAKVGKGVQNHAQRVWQARAELIGARYCVVRSVDEAGCASGAARSTAERTGGGA